jgi:hypothetical protein
MIKNLKSIFNMLLVAFSCNLNASDLQSEIEQYLPNQAMPLYYEQKKFGVSDSWSFGKIPINRKFCPILTNLINKTSFATKSKYEIETNLQILDDSKSGINIDWHKNKASLNLDPRLLIRPQDGHIALNEHELQLHLAQKLNNHKIEKKCMQMLILGPMLSLKLRNVLQNIDHPLCNLINRYDWIFYPTLQSITSYLYLHRFAKNLNKESAKNLGAEDYVESLDNKLNIIFNKKQNSWSKWFGN